MGLFTKQTSAEAEAKQKAEAAAQDAQVRQTREIAKSNGKELASNMNKRELMATEIMANMDVYSYDSVSEAAEDAVSMADKLLLALEKY